MPSDDDYWLMEAHTVLFDLMERRCLGNLD
jgi:hypothetical protein